LVPAVKCKRVDWTEVLSHDSASALRQLDDRTDVLILMNGTLWSTAKGGKVTFACRLAACLEASLCVSVGSGRIRVNRATAEDMSRSVVAVLRRPTLTRIGTKWAGSGFDELDNFVRLEGGSDTALYALRCARAVVPLRPVHINAGLRLERRSVYAGMRTARLAYRAIMGCKAPVTFVTLTQGAAMYKLRHFGLDATRVDRRSYPRAAAVYANERGRLGPRECARSTPKPTSAPAAETGGRGDNRRDRD
jgi:hypothetical protein